MAPFNPDMNYGPGVVDYVRDNAYFDAVLKCHSTLMV
jgi:hypothetical protein